VGGGGGGGGNPGRTNDVRETSYKGGRTTKKKGNPAAVTELVGIGKEGMQNSQGVHPKGFLTRRLGEIAKKGGKKKKKMGKRGV